MKADFIIIGAGVIGINIARNIKRRYPKSHVIVLEKESGMGAHASGRNSGVLHAGFYYTKDSLKAKFTKLGNAALTAYCSEKNIRINRCGKLVVTRNQQELTGLYELYQRGQHNDIEVALISAEAAKKIESRAKTFEQALWSPTTSAVDPKEVLKHMLADALKEGLEVHFGVQYLGYENGQIKTTCGNYSAGYIINAAGLYADKVAKDFGFSKNYAILPFKGIYLYPVPQATPFKTHIYPVPVLENPFLGVHFTVTVDGVAKIGPTAIPAFWREQYQGLSSFNFKEMLDILKREAGLFFKAGFDFKRLAYEEMQKYCRRHLVKHAQELVTGLDQSHYLKWGKPGIRAQLLNVKTRKLEMDFILEGDKRSFHVLNAVSPAFTCSIPFANFVVDQIERA